MTMRLAALLLALLPCAAQAQPLPPLVDGGALDARWRVATLPRQQLPVTRFAPLPPGGREGVSVEAEGSYGNLVLDLPGRAAPRRVAWSWRVDQPNPNADLRRKDGDDSPVKVCLSFDLPLERVPFVERQLLRLARSSTGQALPAATLCWAWGHDEPVGTVIENPYSRRVRTLVLRGRADGSGRWLDESRDVAADFRLAFGDEAAEPPPLLAVGVAGDADNTGSRSRAALAGLRFDG
jgi:hypothetical protein